ncbi:MAG: hypothetical protein ACRD2N_11840 [Vicinamibacterales bacterium]
MSILRTGLVWLLIVGLSTPAVAGSSLEDSGSEREARAPNPGAQASADSLRASAARVAEQVGQAARSSMPKPYLWVGTGLFVGGMAAGLYGFLNNKNGAFPEFGEAESTNTTLGTVGLITAFAGGTVLYLGTRRASSPSVTFGPRGVTVSKQISW